MSWSLHNEIKDFYCATFDLPSNHFVIWVRIKGQLQHEIKDFYFVTFDLPTNHFVIWVRIKNRLTIGPYVKSDFIKFSNTT